MGPGISSERDKKLASIYVFLCGPLLGLSLVLCVTRIYTRSRPVRCVAVDDYLIIAAQVFSLAGYCFGCIAASHGWGYISSHTSPADQRILFSCVFMLQLIYTITVGLIRISVVCSLMRFGSSRFWTWTLYTLIGVQTLLSSVWLVMPLIHCMPLTGLGEPIVKCWPHRFTNLFAWFTTCLTTLMDVMLATMPIKIILSLNRPASEKILINCLMAMGLFATGLAAVQTSVVKGMYQEGQMSSSVEFSIWSKLRELVGLMAACMPCLKALIERALKAVGILSDCRTSISLPSFVQPMPFNNSAHSRSVARVCNSDSITMDGDGNKKSVLDMSKAAKDIESAVTKAEVLEDSESLRTFGKDSNQEHDV